MNKLEYTISGKNEKYISHYITLLHHIKYYTYFNNVFEQKQLHAVIRKKQYFEYNYHKIGCVMSTLDAGIIQALKFP